MIQPPLWDNEGMYSGENMITPESSGVLLVRLVGPLLIRDFHETLKNKTFLSNKILYLVAQKDRNIGRMTDEEINFVKTKFNNFYMIKNAPHGVWTVRDVGMIINNFFVNDILPQTDNYLIEINLTNF